VLINMRNKLLVSLVVLGLIVGAFTMIRPFEVGQNQQNERNNNQINVTHSDSDYGGKEASLIKVNVIKMNETVKNTLNTHPSIITINHNKNDKSHYLNNEVTVKFKTKPSENELARINREIDGKLLKKLDSAYIFRSKSQYVLKLVDYFQNNENVVYAEPNYILLQNQPNDALYRQHQWNLPMIKAEAGWDLTRGDENVVIAVIDTGIELDHPDLSGRITNGYNVLNDNDDPSDNNGHGTHVAGIIASRTNNGEGVAGITWYNRIMPVKVMGTEGYGTSYDVAQGIRWATDHGADVINMSLGNYQDSSVLQEAIQYAYGQDVVLIGASGNDNSDQPSFPAAYPEVMAISAVDDNGNRAQFSNFGDYVDVAAPGVNIASTYLNKQYGVLSGTSMAAPHVTALAALIRSLNPELTNQQVTDIITNSADDLGEPGKDNYYGAGLINIENALNASNQ
jgi:thermitase